jgi:general secretion pathway protein B
MSFILDALRKSENERRDQAQPPLAAAPQAASVKKRSIWPPILAVVLAINAIIFGALILTRDEPAPVAALPPPSSIPDAAPVQTAPTVKTAPPLKTNTPAPPPVASPAQPQTEPQTAPPAKPAADAEPQSSKTIQEGLPNINQLRSTGQISVPYLRVDMHVYSGDATKRFVFINMSKYREGGQLAEGPIIEEITTEGVIMTHEGRRFRLDRD